ncbi:MAG: hypothetical protein ACRD4F_16210, partial [Candidatus Angelobacter sp.]
AGGLAGALIAGVWKPRRRGVLMLCVATVLALGVGSIGLLHGLWQISAVLAVMGVSAGVTNIQIISWVQKRVEQSVRGRVMSVLMFLSLGLMPISLAVSGVLAQWSLKGLFLLGAGALLLVTAAGAMRRSVREIE